MLLSGGRYYGSTALLRPRAQDVVRRVWRVAPAARLARRQHGRQTWPPADLLEAKLVFLKPLQRRPRTNEMSKKPAIEVTPGNLEWTGNSPQSQPQPFLVPLNMVSLSLSLFSPRVRVPPRHASGERARERDGGEGGASRSGQLPILAAAPDLRCPCANRIASHPAQPRSASARARS